MRNRGSGRCGLGRRLTWSRGVFRGARRWRVCAPAWLAAGTSIEKTKPHDRQDRLHAVLPRDLLPLLVAPPVVGDTDLVNSQPRAELGDLRGHFRLEAEAVALD